MPRNNSGVMVLPASTVNPPVAGTVIDPVAFAAALNDIASEITNSFDRLGRAPMLATLVMGGFRLQNVGVPVSQTDAARPADIAIYLPAGAICDFAMNTAPTGWLVCDGSSYLTATYPALFTAIGYTWGGAGANFNVPDFRGTSRRTWDNGKGLDPARVFASYQADMFASHNHTQNPHNHAITDPGHNHTYLAASGASSYGSGGTFALNAVPGANTGNATTGITINNATATNNATGGTETVGKNYAVLTCIRT